MLNKQPTRPTHSLQSLRVSVAHTVIKNSLQADFNKPANQKQKTRQQLLTLCVWNWAPFQKRCWQYEKRPSRARATSYKSEPENAQKIFLNVFDNCASVAQCSLIISGSEGHHGLKLPLRTDPRLLHTSAWCWPDVTCVSLWNEKIWLNKAVLYSLLTPDNQVHTLSTYLTFIPRITRDDQLCFFIIMYHFYLNISLCFSYYFTLFCILGWGYTFV